MLDEEFCTHLEIAISEALMKSTDMEWRRCWCDGIQLPDNVEEYSPGKILRTKEIVTKAWIDEGRTKGVKRGQFLYDMRLKFGDHSLAKLQTRDSLNDCIPDEGADSWIVLDKEAKTIDIQLI